MGVIGNIIKEMDKIKWYEDRPLQGKRIVVTRSQAQAGGLVERLGALGADVLELPVLRIIDPEDKREFAELVSSAHTYDWLVFSSTNGVRRFFDAFFAVYKDARSIGGVRIAVVGPGTQQAVESYRFSADLVPEKHVAEGLVEAFKNDYDIENQTMLWVKPKHARSVITDGLSEQRAIVDECVAYSIEPETDDPTGAADRFKRDGADLITFTSSSTAQYFHDLGLPWPEGCKAASIGPITTSKLKELNCENIIESTEHNIDALVETIVKELS